VGVARRGHGEGPKTRFVTVVALGEESAEMTRLAQKMNSAMEVFCGGMGGDTARWLLADETAWEPFS